MRTEVLLGPERRRRWSVDEKVRIVREAFALEALERIGKLSGCNPKAHLAEMLDEEEDFLHEIVIEMEPEDGVISVYGVGEEYTQAFTTFGIENLKELIPMYRQQVSPTDTTRSCSAG